MTAAIKGEQLAFEQLRTDPFAGHPDLQKKRQLRAPYGHNPPYWQMCWRFPGVRKLLALNGDHPDGQGAPYLLYSDYAYTRDGADWKIRDGYAAKELGYALFALGYHLDRTVQEAPAKNQMDARFDEIPDSEWTGTGDDYSYTRYQDLLLSTTRPPLDDGPSFTPRDTLPRPHTWMAREMFRAARRFFAICHRRTIRLAPAYAARLPAKLANRASILFHTYSSDQMADYAMLGEDGRGEPSHYPRDCGRTCCYLAYAAETELGCPVLFAFGLSGPDTKRFATDLSHSHLCGRLGEVLAGVEDRLLLVEYHTPADGSRPEPEVIFDSGR